MPASKMLNWEEEAFSSYTGHRTWPLQAWFLHLFLDKAKHVTPEYSHLEESVEACWEVTPGDFSEGCAFRLRFRPMQVSQGEGYSGLKAKVTSCPHVWTASPWICP